MQATRKYGIQMPVAISGGGEMLGPLGVRGVPSTVFIDANGTVVGAVTGARQRDYFSRRAEELLERK